MKQIFDRISDITKSYLNDNESYLSDYNSTLKDDDQELKDIIDSLNNPKKKENKKHNTHNNKQENNSNSRKNPIDLNSAYSILGVDKNANIDLIKSAYKNKIKEYHPDKVGSMGKEIQELAKSKTQEINFAYQLIKQKKGF